MIEKERIERIRRTVDLKAYIGQAAGSTFKKNGKGYVCRCPFPDHEDATPSFVVTPSENLFHCFGCNRGGDIFTFDKLYFNLDFTGSVSKHDTGTPSPEPAASTQPLHGYTASAAKGPREMTIKDRKFLARVISYYQHILGEDPAGADYTYATSISCATLVRTC